MALQAVEYEIKESARARSLRITVHGPSAEYPDGRVVITKPARVSIAKAQTFAAGKRDWIEATLAAFKQKAERFERRVGTPIHLPKLRRGTIAYKSATDVARKLVTARTRQLACDGGYRYGTLSIRNQSTRWGSCSAPRGGISNLSFNYRIAQLPPDLQDYLIVHELAHTKEHNHSARFWSLVTGQVPDYKQRRKELHRYRF